LIFSELSKYPTVRRDVTLILDKNINFADAKRLTLINEIRGLAKIVNIDSDCSQIEIEQKILKEIQK